MRKKQLCYAILGGMCATSSFILSSCVDNDYDLTKDIDLTIQVGGNLSIPGCNTEEITLKKIFDLDENDPDNVIKADADGFYALSKKGNGSDSEFTVEAVDIRNVENGEGENEELDFPKADLENNGRAESKVENNTSTFSTADDITKDIISIDYAESNADIPVILKLFFSQGNNVPVLHLADDFTINFPDYLDMRLDKAALEDSGEENDYEFDAAGTNTLNFKTEKFINEGHHLEIPLLIDYIHFGRIGAPEDYLRFRPEEETNELFVSGEIVINGTAYLLDSDFGPGMLPTEDVHLRLHSEFLLGNQDSDVKFTIDRVRGVVDPDIDVTVDPVAFDNLPDFLADDDVVMDMTNPMVLLTIRNSAPADVNIYGDLVSRKGDRVVTVPIGKGDDGIHVTEPILVKADATSLICLSRLGEGAPEGAVNVKVERMNDLIEKLPDDIVMENIVAKILQQEYVIDLGRTYQVSTSYDVDTPLAFGENVDIVYRDTIDGWNEDIADLDVEIKELDVVMDAINKIPLDLRLSVLPVDLNGDVIPETEISVSDPEQIEPGNGLKGNESGAVKTTVTFKLRTVKEGAMQQLDGLIVKVDANNKDYPDYQNLQLNENQTLKLDNIRLNLPEGVKMNLN